MGHLNNYSSLFLDIFNCDPPPSPSNGYIDSYNRTAEGLTISFVCQNKTICVGEMQEAVQDIYTAVCTLDGTWEPNLDDFCSRQGMIFILHTII